MDRMPLVAVFFQSIPESLILLCLGLAIMGARPDFRNLLPAAILLSVSSWFVRALPLPFGIHTLIGVVVLAFLLNIIFRFTPLQALGAGLFALSSLLSVEAVYVPIIFKVVDIINVQFVWNSPFLRIILSWPELVFLGGAAYLMLKFNISFESLARRAKEQDNKGHH